MPHGVTRWAFPRLPFPKKKTRRETQLNARRGTLCLCMLLLLLQVFKLSTAAVLLVSHIFIKNTRSLGSSFILSLSLFSETRVVTASLLGHDSNVNHESTRVYLITYSTLRWLSGILLIGIDAGLDHPLKNKWPKMKGKIRRAHV